MKWNEYVIVDTFYLKNQLYYQFLLFIYRVIGLCQGRKEGLGTCPTSSCTENSLPLLKSDIIVGPLKSVLLFMLFIFRLQRWRAFWQLMYISKRWLVTVIAKFFSLIVRPIEQSCCNVIYVYLSSRKTV